MEFTYLFILSVLGSIVVDEIISDSEHMPQVHLWQKVDDMVLSPIQTQFLYTPFFNKERNARRNGIYRWQNATIPYEFDSEFNNEQRELVKKVLQEKFAETCVKFRPRRKTDRNYIRVISGNGCYSNVGRGTYMQRLSLNKRGCMLSKTIAHEFLHALGLFHQQSASNRDDYVTVQWHNIKTGSEQNFEKYEPHVVIDFGLPYDYGSIMHYISKAFSKNGKPTLVSRTPNVKFGNAKALSPIDIMKVNKMYDCKNSDLNN